MSRLIAVNGPQCPLPCVETDDLVQPGGRHQPGTHRHRTCSKFELQKSQAMPVRRHVNAGSKKTIVVTVSANLFCFFSAFYRLVGMISLSRIFCRMSISNEPHPMQGPQLRGGQLGRWFQRLGPFGSLMSDGQTFASASRNPKRFDSQYMSTIYIYTRIYIYIYIDYIL